MQIQLNFKRVYHYLFGKSVSPEQRTKAIQEAREEALELKKHDRFSIEGEVVHLN